VFSKNISLIIATAFVFSFCTNDVSNETLFSSIDGIEHAEILDGKNSVNKNTLLVLYNRSEEVDLLNRIYISDSLSCSDSIWQMHYLHAIFKICNDLNQEEKKHVGPNLFYYFLHQPLSFYMQLNDLPIVESDCILNLIGQEIKYNTQKEGITLISIKNLAFSNCLSCSKSQLLALDKYIELADKMFYD
jgi:hypothetical protein